MITVNMLLLALCLPHRRLLWLVHAARIYIARL
jgi:hypothetical protein